MTTQKAAPPTNAELLAALEAVLPFAKAYTLQHEHIGNSCPWCISTNQADEVIRKAKGEL